MTKLRRVEDIRSGDDALRWAEQHGASVRHGRHTVVSTEAGCCAIPCHGRKDLPTGTRRQIVKLFLLMGLAVVALVVCCLA